MTHRAIQLPISACLMIAALLAVPAISADPPQAPPEEKKAEPVPKAPGEAPNKDNPEKGKTSEADEQYRREAEKFVNSIDLEMMVGEKWVKVKRIEKALLYYGDPTRENDRGSMWAWGETGRPVAHVELFQNSNDREKWAFALCNPSGGKVRARLGNDPWWRENESASELKDIPGAPAPAADAALRQRQLKQLAQKFTGHEFWDPNNSRFELRRLERPLHTYRDEDSGLLDGAVFTLANGTNPEIMLFIEARVNPKDKSKSVWQYTVGRSAHAELHLEYDGKEVFDAPRGHLVSGPEKPYWLGFTTTKPAPKPGK